jgi:CRISPR-associated endonuclease Cas3-HD
MPSTISEAMNILERAFRSRNPSEIERVLRDMISIRIAVADSLMELEQKIRAGFYPLTVTVPYGVFANKIREKRAEVYVLDLRRVKDRKSMERVKMEELSPNATYILFKKNAGYSAKMGLTFDGEGEVTGFEQLNDAEKAEKFSGGRDQTWRDHALGTQKKAKRMLEIYRPFIEDWFKSVFKNQDPSKFSIKENTEAVVLAIEIAVLFHDLGKLRKQWQDAVGWDGKQYIARTKDKHNVPFHAPYAYPFLRKMLRFMFGDFRFLDLIALATVRHHSLEVSGMVKPDQLELADKNVPDFLYELLREFLGTIDVKDLKEVLVQSLEEVNRGAVMDEPPSPSDDFYFIYALTNRAVKFADWEDASDNVMELRDLKRW